MKKLLARVRSWRAPRELTYDPNAVPLHQPGPDVGDAKSRPKNPSSKYQGPS